MCRILPVLTKTVMIVFDLRAIDLMKIWRGATTHHSLLSLYSLQSLPLPAWQLCNMITPDMRILELFLSNISGKHSPISMWQPRLAHGNTKWWWEKGDIPDKSLFTSVWNLRTHLQKPSTFAKKNRNIFEKQTNTFSKKKSEHICKKNRNIFAKNKNTFAKKLGTHLQKNASYLLFSLNPWKDAKLWQSWNEGGWIVRDHLQDTFGSFPKWQMIIMLVGAEEIIPGWGKEWENSEKVRCCTVPSLQVPTPVPPKHWQYLSMLFTQGIHSIPHSP